MSVINEFEVSSIKSSLETRKVYMLESSSATRMTFDYTFYCKAYRSIFFFDFSLMRVLIVIDSPYKGGHICGVMKFWVKNDRPEFACQWLAEQNKFIASIQHEFQEKYANHLMDDIINS